MIIILNILVLIMLKKIKHINMQLYILLQIQCINIELIILDLSYHIINNVIINNNGL